MDGRSARILWANLLTLMESRYGGENQNRLSRDAGIGIATINRIKAGSTSVGIDILAKIAAVFALDAWQLIAPTSETAKCSLSPLALDLARELDKISDPALQRRAHAVAYQVLSFVLSPLTAPAAAPSDPPAKPVPATHP